ncbi:MAG: ATP-binding protein, partial [Oscillospiraceae bacterium]|nr:ATP-binding protein [Oscillospiraceae bacterium]
VIFGANASGKSNLISAMSFMSSFMYSSHERKPDEPINIEPFALDENFKNKPSKFDVIFYKERTKLNITYKMCPFNL